MFWKGFHRAGMLVLFTFGGFFLILISLIVIGTFRNSGATAAGTTKSPTAVTKPTTTEEKEPNPAPAARHKQNEDYVAIVRQVAQPLEAQTRLALRSDSLAIEFPRFLKIMQVLQKTKPEDTLLDDLRLKMLDELQVAGKHLERIVEIDRKKPANWQLFTKVMAAASDEATDEQKDELGEGLLDRLGKEFEKSLEESGYRDTMAKFCWRSLGLFEVAKKYAGPSVDDQEMLSIDLNEGWKHMTNDWLTLTNTSGQDLQQCTVYVKTSDENGQQHDQLYYVESWPAGKERYAAFINAGTYLPGSRTGRHIKTVKVWIWASEGQQELTYEYTRDRWHEDLANYCGQLKFSLGYLARNGSQGSGVEFDYKGMSSLPQADVLVTYTSGSRQEQKVWKNQSLYPAVFENWKFTSNRWMFRPDKVEMAIRFHDSGYVHKVGVLDIP